MPGTNIVLSGGVPEEYQYISLSEVVNWAVKPWEWEDVGLEWIQAIRIWNAVKPKAAKLHQEWMGK